MKRIVKTEIEIKRENIEKLFKKMQVSYSHVNSPYLAKVIEECRKQARETAGNDEYLIDTYNFYLKKFQSYLEGVPHERRKAI